VSDNRNGKLRAVVKEAAARSGRHGGSLAKCALQDNSHVTSRARRKAPFI
jgi:hypothetical protein